MPIEDRQARDDKAQMIILGAMSKIDNELSIIEAVTFDVHEKSRLHILDYNQVDKIVRGLNEIRNIIANG